MNCTAKTRSGKPCRRDALRGSDVCHAHSDAVVGRPLKLSPEVERRLVEAIKAGASKETAARFAGISSSTFHRWSALAEADARFAKLSEKLEQAEAGAEIHAIATIRARMADDWRAAGFFLERRHPERWARRRPEEHRRRRWWGPPDLDVSEPKTRRLLSELLGRKPAGR